MDWFNSLGLAGWYGTENWNARVEQQFRSTYEDTYNTGAVNRIIVSINMYTRSIHRMKIDNMPCNRHHFWGWIGCYICEIFDRIGN